MKINYLGKQTIDNIFQCEICGHRGRDKYIATPETSLVDWKELAACKKCARREIGSKNIKLWNKIHE